ncbi:Indy-2 [Bugula neritina]|uniref:Indy-2 n=1 Tax=Bugula neritina TaxID=10212 RepID=A0A7J7KHG6_BUGNE|nr:Indy-2 [Bugula neritina]
MASTNNHLSPSMDKDIKVDFSPESSQHDFITSTEPLAKLSDPLTSTSVELVFILPNIVENEYPLEPQNEENGVAVSEAPPTSSKEGEEELKPSEMSPKFQNLGKAVSLSICYAANIGGTGTLTGTGPNLLIGDTMSKYFPESDDITFGSWILFSLPLMIICLFICWVILVIMFLGPRTLFCRENDAEFENEGGKLVLKREYQKLGKTSCPEIILITFFVILVLLWLFRDPKFMPGWSSAFEPKFVTDAATGLFICTLLFVFPSSFPGISGHKSGLQLGPPILDWPTVQKKLPWGVIILLGGGFALADMCKKSGLSDWLGCKLGVLDSIPPSALVFICGVVMTFFTEFTSNTSSASIFLPILAQLVKSGMLMNFLCLGACMLAINTWGTAYFKLNTFPDWANITTTSQCT